MGYSSFKIHLQILTAVNPQRDFNLQIMDIDKKNNTFHSVGIYLKVTTFPCVHIHAVTCHLPFYN